MTSDRILTGLALRLLAALSLATLSALIKLAEAHGATLGEIMFFRQASALPVVVAWLAAGPGLGTVRTARIGAHITRTAIGLSGMAFNFGTLLLLPLAEATTLLFTVPIFATILGALLLREPTGWHRWGAVAVGFIGVLIVAHPSGGHLPLAGLAVGLTAGLLMALVMVQLRQMGRTEGTGTTVFWFTALSVPPLAILYCFDFQPHDAATWAMLVSMGLFGGIGQLALTGALRFAPVSTVVPMDYSSLLWATLYGWLIFGVWPTPYTWMGAPVIIASGLYIVWRERKRGLPVTAVSAADTPA
jgi:drug/metabolite transporter (DMT)-like permease